MGIKRSAGLTRKMMVLTQVSLANSGDAAEMSKAAPVGGGGAWLVVRTLAWRELVRFFRQRGRIMGAIATPVLLWLAIGLGLDEAFVMPAPEVGAGDPALRGLGAGVQQVGYLMYFYPGMVLMMVLWH